MKYLNFKGSFTFLRFMTGKGKYHFFSEEDEKIHLRDFIIYPQVKSKVHT